MLRAFWALILRRRSHSIRRVWQGRAHAGDRKIGRQCGDTTGKEEVAGVTNTVTLISGERDAVLVDTFMSVQHSKELVEWVAASGKNLTYHLYLCHAHGDHFFGLKFLLDRFPNARAFATGEAALSRSGSFAFGGA